jgi:hypothetical protein
MKKFIGWSLAIIVLLAISVFIFYKFYFPTLVADVLTQDKASSYIPKFVNKRIQRYKAPVNKGAADVIEEIHRSNVTLDQILEAVDNTQEEQVYEMLDELNSSKPKSTNQVFDLAKKHFPVDFDIEVLRAPFNKNVNMTMIKKGLSQANARRGEEGVDPEMAKAVVKQILRQKEKEYNRAVGLE